MSQRGQMRFRLPMSDGADKGWIQDRILDENGSENGLVVMWRGVTRLRWRTRKKKARLIRC